MPERAVKTRRTQQERKAESERKIIRAARELFAKQGYMRTTLNEVGTAAGYTGGLVTHRFGSKEGLLNAVVNASAGRFLNDQVRPALADLSPAESLDSYIAIYLREITKRESHMRALYVIMGEALGAVPEIRGRIAALNADFRDGIADFIRAGIDAGEYRSDVDVEAASVLILGLLRGVTMQILADKSACDIEQMIPLMQQQVQLALR